MGGRTEPRDEPRDHLLARAHAHWALVLVEKAKQDADPRVVDEAEEHYRTSATIVQGLNLSRPEDLNTAMKAIAERCKTRDPARAESLYREAFARVEVDWLLMPTRDGRSTCGLSARWPRILV